MPDGWNIGTIVAIITAMGGILAVWYQGRKNRHDAIRMINESYSELCNRLQERVKALHDDIKQAEARIAVLEAENADLKKQLAESIRDRERLTQEVEELSERLAKYENRPQRSTTRKAAQ
jgi:septal ring factor EnvC (AmiA/AmiB activator)